MPSEPASAPRDFAANSPPSRRASVLLPLPLSGAYDYLVPEPLAVTPGDFVIVPLGRRRVVGVVWDRSDEADAVAEGRLKPVEAILDTPPMAATMRRFVDWVAAYSLTPPGAVLRMAMSVPSALEEPRARQALRATGVTPSGTKLTEKRRRVLVLLEDGRAMTAAALSAEAGVTSAVLRDMTATGLLEAVDLPEFQEDPTPDPMHREALDGDQKAAAEDLIARVVLQGFSVALLDGVTGSGKTEVYFAAIEAALQAGRQCLVLLPEIALSGQWLVRFQQRFGFAATLWHSDIRSTTRRDTWRRIARGRASVVVGARSALFLPLDHLGLIIVDEEHEASFKQEEGVLYNARDMAVVRGRLAEVPVVLVSATPSLETLNNVALGRYDRLHLPERHGAAGMPEVMAIDVRRDPPPRGRWITPTLADVVEQTLARGEQAMLFLNRRGYAPLTLCRHCGYRVQCPNCSAWLVEHRLVRRLVCHHCGHSRPLPKTCPQCQEPDSLVACGPGVERLAEEAATLFPDARLAVMASDLLIGPDAAADLVARMAAREIDILIGTQMIAKGHHFPHLTLVGVVDADLGLGGGDLRAGERTYQLLHQVSGRAGRADHPGRVMLQTAMPENPVIQALLSGDRDRFIAAEMAEREAHFMPPFGRLAGLVVSSGDGAAAEQTAKALARAAPRGDGITVLGPAPAPLALLRGRHRFRLLLKVRREVPIQKVLREWLGRVGVAGTVRVTVDVDPQSFL